MEKYFPDIFQIYGALGWPHLTLARSGHSKGLQWEAAPKLSWQWSRSCQFLYGFWVLFLSWKVTYWLKEAPTNFWMQILVGLFTRPRPLLCWHIKLSDRRSCFFPANQEIASVKGSIFQPSSPSHEGSTEVTGQPVTGRGPPSVRTQWKQRSFLFKNSTQLASSQSKGLLWNHSLTLSLLLGFFSLAYRETGDRFLVLILITSVWKRFLLRAEDFWIWKKKFLNTDGQLVLSLFTLIH